MSREEKDINLSQIHPDLVDHFICLAPRPVDGSLGAIPDIRAELAERRCRDKFNVPLPGSDRIVYTKQKIPGPTSSPDVLVGIHKPVTTNKPLPVLLWLHGGGYVIGDIDMDVDFIQQIAIQAECVIVSVEYRLAPENPFPAGLEDSYAALKWIARHAAELGVNASSIAIGGISGGGGLAAALALLVHDRAEIEVMFQFLLCPMLDDRNITPSSRAIIDERVPNRENTKRYWEVYLKEARTQNPLSPYAVPARAANLAGLPPAYIAVGALDMFVDENIDYAQRLIQAGVPAELHIFPRAYHAFEYVVPQAGLSRHANRLHCHALKQAFTKSSQECHEKNY